MKIGLGFSTISTLMCLTLAALAQPNSDGTTEAATSDPASTAGTSDKTQPSDAQATTPTSGKEADEKGASTEAPHTPEQKPASTTAILFNPIGLIFGLYNVDVGVGVADKLSANFGGSYWSFSILGVKNTAWGLTAGAQYFFYGKRFDGAFVYPALELARSTVSYSDTSISGTLFGPSAIVGYQWDWKPFTLRLGGGVRYYLGSVGGSGYKSDLQGAALKLDGSLGFTF